MWEPASDTKTADLEYSPLTPEISNQNIIANTADGVEIKCISDSNPIADIVWDLSKAPGLSNYTDIVGSTIVISQLPIGWV